MPLCAGPTRDCTNSFEPKQNSLRTSSWNPPDSISESPDIPSYPGHPLVARTPPHTPDSIRGTEATGNSPESLGRIRGYSTDTRGSLRHRGWDVSSMHNSGRISDVIAPTASCHVNIPPDRKRSLTGVLAEGRGGLMIESSGLHTSDHAALERSFSGSERSAVSGQGTFPATVPTDITPREVLPTAVVRGYAYPGYLGIGKLPTAEVQETLEVVLTSPAASEEPRIYRGLESSTLNSYTSSPGLQRIRSASVTAVRDGLGVVPQLEPSNVRVRADSLSGAVGKV